jgi:ribonuclease HI
MAVMTAAEAEAWSLLKGLQWIASYNYQHVIIELDCQQVVNDVCTNNQIALNMV